MKMYILAALMAVASFSAHAQVVPEEVIRIQSIASETQDQFILRVASWMHGWTKQNNAESCGLISQKDGIYYIIVNTIHSQLSCKADTIITDTTYVASIHSHPICDGSNHITVTDGTRKAEPWLDRSLARMEVNTKIFSKQDFASGAGYLVANDRLMYQSGRGTVQVVADKLPENI